MYLALIILLSLAIILPLYSYLLYPIILKALIRIKDAPVSNKESSDSAYTPQISVIVAAYNEEKHIGEKIINLMALDYPNDRIEFLVGSDGSLDATVVLARQVAHDPRMRIFDLPRGGKVNTLNRLLGEAKGEILVFSDANTMFNPMAIRMLVRHMVDPKIGCVSGQLRYQISAKSGYGAISESVYWRYENWVKELESRLGRLSGANGGDLRNSNGYYSIYPRGHYQ